MGTFTHQAMAQTRQRWALPYSMGDFHAVLVSKWDVVVVAAGMPSGAYRDRSWSPRPTFVRPIRISRPRPEDGVTPHCSISTWPSRPTRRLRDTKEGLYQCNTKGVHESSHGTMSCRCVCLCVHLRKILYMPNIYMYMYVCMLGISHYYVASSPSWMICLVLLEIFSHILWIGSPALWC